MEFMNPAYLWLLIIVPLAVMFYIRHAKKRQHSALLFSRVDAVKRSFTKKHRTRRHILFCLLLSVYILLVLGLADPHVALKHTKKGVNVALALDVSGSMQAEDFTPNRMEAAKRASSTLIENLKPKDKVGIITFESGATTASYFTPLKDRALDKLSSIKAKRGKTAIGDGLGLAVDMVTSIPNKKKVIILLSDGVNNAGVIKPPEAIEYAREENIQVHTVGLGSREKTMIGRDMFGQAIYAKLDEELLKQIASETGGSYHRAVDDETLNQIYKGLSEDIEREKEDTSIKDWFVLAAIVVLLVTGYLMYGRYRIVA